MFFITRELVDGDFTMVKLLSSNADLGHFLLAVFNTPRDNKTIQIKKKSSNQEYILEKFNYKIKIYMFSEFHMFYVPLMQNYMNKKKTIVLQTL